MSLEALPSLNAVLNATASILLVTGWILIRRKRPDLHEKAMTAAFLCSILFLVSYLTYHSVHGTTRFQGTGAIRTVYFTVLGTHTVLAALVAPLAARTFWLGRTGRREAHRRLARVTLPIWLYVSVTGVAIYGMLYHM